MQFDDSGPPRATRRLLPWSGQRLFPAHVSFHRGKSLPDRKKMDFLRHKLLRRMGSEKQARQVVTGRICRHPWRAIDRDIPSPVASPQSPVASPQSPVASPQSPVASPQSLNPFLPAPSTYSVWNRSLQNKPWTQEPIPEKIQSLGYTLAVAVTTRRCGKGLMNPRNSTHRFFRGAKRNGTAKIASMWEYV